MPVSEMLSKLPWARRDRARPRAVGVFNGSGRAGPLRPALIVGGVVAIAAAAVFASRSGDEAMIVSRDARMKAVDPLPGGLHTTPEQDALAIRANGAQAQAALLHGVSFTPPMAPSVRFVLPTEVGPPGPRHWPVHSWTRPARPTVPVVQAVFREPAPEARPAPEPDDPPPEVEQVASTGTDPQQQAAYSQKIGDMLSQWGVRPPHTDVLMSPAATPGSAAGDTPVAGSGSDSLASRGPVSAVRVSSNADTSDVLIPAGRGVYAHPILALSSDETSPVVMQADTGPIAGDRMIGSFSREDDRLIIHISSIIHQGEVLRADGVVIAPETMEASVASDVDQHYLTRFILPAAAAFVSGLGQAIATTTNTAAVLSPLGGVTTSTNLNFHQQLGVAAGTAAAQIGSTLAAAAPKGPTVSLEANVAVGVMFLSNVTARPNR